MAGARPLRGARARRALAAGFSLTALAAAGLPSPAAAMPADLPTGGVTPAAAREPVIGAGSYGAPAPQVLGVACLRDCGAAAAARPGALVRVAGRRVGAVQEVLFLAGPGPADDTSVVPRATGRRAVLARVPRTTGSGPVALALRDGTRSAPSRTALIVETSAPVTPAGALDVEVQVSKVFFGAPRAAELSYVLGGDGPATVTVELVRSADETLIARWTEPDVRPGIPGTIRWDGVAGGHVQRDGEYRFRVSAAPTPGAATLSSGAADAAPAVGTAARAAAAEGSFTFMRHRFPIAGAHTYGVGAAAFGGDRGHQGQDVFAECGTPVVAARGGKVTFKQFEGRAGHYVVIDGRQTEIDYAYMHLRDAALVDTGDRVRTGELIGYVGATGRASGCHLHFELWSGPGWYKGGAPISPVARLRAWDAQS